MNVLSRGILLVFGLILSTISLQAQNCTVNAGIPTSVCPGSAFTLNGSANGLISSAPVWSQVSGPAVTITSPGSLTSTVTGYAPGNSYTFRLSAQCTDGSLIYDQVTYTTYALTTSNAGSDQVLCPGSPTLAANAANTGAGEIGTWTTVSGSSVTFTGANANKAALPVTVPNNKSGVTVLMWTIKNSTSGCTSSSTVSLTNYGGVSPVTAGANQTLSACYDNTQSATLNASYGGDVNNTYPQQVGTWTMLSGPSTPTFANTHNYNTGISNLKAGTYTLRWTVAGSCVNGSATMTITVPTAKQGNTSASTTGATTYCDGRTSALITGTTPNYAGETFTWTTVTGGGGTVASTNAPSSNVSGLTPPTATAFNYTIANPTTGCSSSGKYTINFTSPPTISAASPIVTACGATSVSIPYTVSGGDLTQWALVSAPTGISTTSYATAGASPFNPGITMSKIGTYVYRLKRTTNSGSGGCQDAYVDVSVQVSQQPDAANAGTRSIVACNVFTATLSGNAPTVGTGAWSQVSGPNTATIANKLQSNTGVSGMVNGVYTFRWIITGNVGCTNTQADVQVVVASTTPTTSAAGSDQSICASTPYQLHGNKPVLNETGTWTVTPSTGVTFSDVNDNNAVANGMAQNTAYQFTWTIKNACGTSSSNVNITTSATAGPKQATAGPDQCLGAAVTSFTLAGNAPGTGETGLWSLLSGPNTPTITNSANYNTTVTGAVNGTYSLEWSLARNGCTPTRDTVLVTLSGAATTAAAGTSQSLCGNSTVTLAGNNPTIGTGTWTQTQGPGGAVFTNPNANNTTVTNIAAGVYTFRWTISNGACPSNFSDVNYNITAAPTPANAGPNISICSGISATMAANTITSGTGLWAVVSGPSTPTIASPSSPTTNVTNLKMGTYVLSWTSSTTPTCTSTSNVTIYVTQPAAVTVATQNLCNAISAAVAANDGSTGTWTQSGTTPNVATITQTPANGPQATITNMVPGSYTFVYTMAAVGACPATTSPETINNSALPDPAKAGPDQSFCISTATTNATLAATAASPSPAVGKWSYTGPAGATFGNNTSATSTFNNMVPGTYILTWSVTGGTCTANNTDVMRIDVYAQPTTSNAGATQPNACSGSVFMAGNTPTVGLGTWTNVSGPNTPTFDAPNSPTTQVLGTIVSATPYVFQWSIANGTCTPSTSTVSVTVTSTPPTTTANANVGSATPSIVCNTPGPTTTLAMHGNAAGTGETGTWTMTANSGTGTPVIVTPTLATTNVTGLTAGTYTMQWTISKGSCNNFSTVSFTVYDAPTVANAGVDQTVCLYSVVTLAANTPTKGTGSWSVVSGPSTPVFSSTTAANATLNGLQAGTYILRWTTTNGNCTTTDDVQILVEDCRISVVKTATTPARNADGTYNITFSFLVTNPAADIAINNVQVTDNLTAAFPSPKVVSVVSLSATGGLSGATNSSFDGNSNQNLLNATASLPKASNATITLVVKVKL